MILRENDSEPTELVTKIDAENLGKAYWKPGEVPGPALPPFTVFEGIQIQKRLSAHDIVCFAAENDYHRR
jgi:hypothetical protein